MRAAYIRGLVLCAVPLAGCFAAQAGQLADDPDAPWIPGLPIANSFAGIVELDSDPSGAEATTSLGGSCRTPCALELSAEGPFTVTFTHEERRSRRKRRRGSRLQPRSPPRNRPRDPCRLRRRGRRR